MAEDVVQQVFHARVQGRICLALGRRPEFIVLCETLFKRVGRKVLMDPSLVASTITGVDSDDFSKQLRKSESAYPWHATFILDLPLSLPVRKVGRAAGRVH